MASNINVSELITDPDFARKFVIERHENGTFIDGLYTSSVINIDVVGIIQPYQPETAEYTPNGDMITGDIKIWSKKIIYTTREKDDNSGTSDIIIYKDEKYKVTYVKDWEEHGYWSAVAKRLSARWWTVYR